MPSPVATHRTHRSCQSAAKRPAGVTKPVRTSVRALRSFHEHFWYTSTHGVDRLATSSSTPFHAPRYVNDHRLDPSLFADHPYPTSFPPGEPWPPQTAPDLLHSHGNAFNDCVGDRCYTDDVCEEAYCDHTFENWKAVTQDWQDHFELRRTQDRGIGVFTNRSFKQDDVLGWYAGEIIPSNAGLPSNAYLLEVPIGKHQEDLDTDSGYASSSSSSFPGTPSLAPLEVTVMIDGEKQGNWTRFINHSCAPHCHFRIRRVGKMRIMTVEAIRNIPAGVELTVSYGPAYYGPESQKICHCGAKNCVSRARKVKVKEDQGLWRQEKKRVKKCRRMAPPG